MMNNQDNVPLLSVVIPVLNASSYLKECLNSVIAQTLSNIEIVCVYDKSNDSSLEILCEFAKNDNRIKILYGNGRGLSAARNIGINATIAKYIFFFDADDFITNNACEIIVKKMAASRHDILVFGSKPFPDNADTPFFYYFQMMTRNVEYEHACPKALFGELGARPYVWRNCYRRDFLINNNLRFDEEIKVGEDQLFQIESFPLAKNGICFIKDILYFYRWNAENSLQKVLTNDIVKKLNGHIELVKKAYYYYDLNDFNSEWRYYLLLWAIDFLSEEIPYMPFCDNYCLNIRALNVLDLFFIRETYKSKLPLFFIKKIKLLENGSFKRTRISAQFDTLYRRLFFLGFNKTILIYKERIRYERNRLVNNDNY